ncbi:MAG: glycosyltransferase family 39 protein [Ardenticatenaceae bacterium]|nr:glycosyltransferase family 39 protein [Ardenticatenaceae bacterium]
MSNQSAQRILNLLISLIILIFAFWLRTSGLAWDHLRHYHPDERYISWVASSIEFTGHENWSDLLNPQTSRFNPYYWPKGQTTEGIVVPFDQNRNFAYGHLPLYLGVGLTRLLEQLAIPWESLPMPNEPLEFDYLTVASRFLTALFDMGSIVLLFLIGRRLFSPLVGGFAAALLAVTVMHIQLSHFFISDTYLTFFIVLTVDGLTRACLASSPGAQKRALAVGAIAAGMAIGSKFSAVLLGLPILITLIFLYQRRFWRPALGVASLTLVAFALTNPFAVLDFSCPPEDAQIAGQPLVITHCYLQNIARESAMVRGSEAFPFTRQYDNTTAIVYPIVNQLRWGMGWPMGLIAFAGFAVIMGTYAVDGLRHWRERKVDKKWVAAGVILTWVIPYFFLTTTFQVKFMRYLQPVTPFLLLFGSWLLLEALPLRWRTGGKIAAVIVWVMTALYALAFTGIYRQPHPWQALSIWVYEQIPAGETIAIELWDETLPSNLSQQNKAWVRSSYQMVELNWLSRAYAADDERKLRRNLENLAAADYWIVASNRNYGVVSRLPEAYPITHQVYEKLFRGDLGYVPVYVGDRPLSLGPVQLTPNRFATAGLEPPEFVAEHLSQTGRLIGPAADESFTVYDQPLVIVFFNQERLSAEELQRLFIP